MLRFIALLAVLSFSGGIAQAQNVFTVPQVPVFAEAETSAEAQDVARSQGRAVALDILLRRLVAEEDWMYLPRLAEGQPAPAFAESLYQPLDVPVSTRQPITIEAAQLAQLEQGFDVFNEKSSGTTYRAEITFRFKPDAVRALLQNSRIPYSEEQARPVLILPVLETEENIYLWETKNPWARAWLERPLTSELTPMLLPVGDVVDIQAITAEEAHALNAAALRDFMERYEVEQVFVALGRLSDQNDSFRFFVRLIEATPPEYGASRSTSAIGTTVTEAFFRGANDDFPVLARQAVQGTVQRHARAWKRQTLVDYSTERSLEVTAWYGDLEEWADIRAALESTPLVRSLDPGVFNRENAIIQMTVVGDDQQFRLAMEQRGLVLWQDTSGRWYLAEADRAAELQQSLEPLEPTIDEQANRGRSLGLGRIFGRRGEDEGGEGSDAPADDSDIIEQRSGEDIPDLPEDLFGDDAPGGGGR